MDSVRQLEVGVAGGNPVLSESLMITGDADESGLAGEAPNIVDVQLLVQYDIKDIEAYLYRVSDPDGQTIKDVTETALRQVIGSRPIDDVLTDKKEDIQAETKLLLQGLLDYYNTGLNVREVKLLNVFAPEQVKDAFDDVVRAKEDKARMINLADAYKESILPQARGEAARVTEAAEAYKQERIAIAEGQAERFKAILFEYEKAPEVTRQRLFLEAMEEILPGVRMYIMSGEAGNSVLPLLPLTDNGQLPTTLWPKPVGAAKLRFIALILILLAVIAAIIGPQLFFVVDEKELAIVTRFGQVQKSINSPGLYVKTPFIDATTYYDKRLLIFDAPPDSLLTKDKKRLIIDVYARGRIVDPKLFRETVRTEAGGKARAVDILSSELRREIASDNQSEIITTKREDIMNRIRDNVKPKLGEFGLDIIDVRIKRADFPPEIAESVYARMQAERKRISDKERAEGAEIDAQVRATVDRDRHHHQGQRPREPPT